MCDMTEAELERKIVEVASGDDDNAVSYVERRDELIKELEHGEEIDPDVLRRPVTS